MKHTFKAILALLLSLMLALSMWALADNEVEEEIVEAEQTEAVAALPEADETVTTEETFVEAELGEDAPVVEEIGEAEGVGEGNSSTLSDDESFSPEEKALEDDPIEETPVEEGEPSVEEESIESEALEGDQPAEEEPAEDEPADEDSADEQPTEEQSTDEDSADERPVDDQSSEEQPVIEEEPVEELSALTEPTANALVYNGELQALVNACEGWLFSMDGEEYSPEPPVALNAGEYTVYCVPADDADAEPVVLTVIIDKADVTFTPPAALVE